MMATTWMLLAATALGAEQVSIEARCGTVRVTGGAETTTVERDGKPAGKGGGSWWGARCEQIVVRAPDDATVRLETLEASLVVSEFGGRVRFESVSGPLTITGEQRRPVSVEAETVSGALTIAAGAKGEVHAESVSGAIVVSGGPLQRVDVETLSGAVEIAAPLAVDAWIRAEAYSGSVTILVDRAPAAVETESFSGPVRVEVKPTAAAGEGPRVEAETFSGPITVVPGPHDGH